MDPLEYFDGDPEIVRAIETKQKLRAIFLHGGPEVEELVKLIDEIYKQLDLED